MTDQLRMTVQQCEPGRSGQPTHRLSHEPTVEHLLVLSQAPPSGVGEPHQSAAAIGGVALALQQTVTLQLGDDVADDRLGAGEVIGGLPDGERPASGQMLEDGSRGSSEFTALPVPPVQREVCRGEQFPQAIGRLLRGREQAHGR